LKNFTFLLLAVSSFLIFTATAKAQTEPLQRNCATDEMMRQVFQNDPAARARYQNTQQLLDSRIRTILNNPLNRTQAIVTIPVVVRIGIPNPTLVTDAIVQNQIDTLNFFYGAQPLGDSLRVYTPFRTSYGRSEIRFCLAQRTPTNTPTTGILRTPNTTIYTTTHPSVDLGSWDPTKYLNVWVVQLGGGLLGYSFLPGTFPPSDPMNGFVNDYRAFGSGPGTSSGGYHYNFYNLGKTAVHEIGHFFNLEHPWGGGNDNPLCTQTDNCADTPPTDAPTFGCPAIFPVTNSCSPVAPGVMHQNHMDYADDACMFLFTVNQCTRMTASLILADRVGLTTSNGCQPIVTTNDDAGVSAIIEPSNNSSTACSAIPLRITLRNFGSNNVASAVINVRVNGTLVATQNFAGNLVPSATTNITLANLNIAATGTQVIKVHSTTPNGNPDSSPANDTSTVTITRTTAVALPVVETFEGASFPSAGWSANNPDGPPSIPGQSGFGWTRRASVPSPNGTRAAEIDFYNYSTLDAKDSLITPDINMTNPPGLKLVAFDRAHASFGYPPIFPANVDTMEIMVSTNCGASYTSVWKKYGAIITNPNSLNTTTFNTTGEYIPASVSDWLTETIDITPVVGASPIARVMFKTTNRYGNFLFLDNINVRSQFNRDLGVSVINSPITGICASTITPEVVVRNFGAETVTSYTVQYTIDGANPLSVVVNTSIAPGGTATIILPVSGALAAGIRAFRATTANPVSASGTGEQNTLNDALTRNIIVRNITDAPAIETFEGSTFPSTNWSIANPNSNNTWQKRNGIGYLSYNSLFIDNYNTNTPNQIDDYLTPVFRTTGTGAVLADSIIITWDLAHNYYPFSPFDTLSVVTSSDCGNTFPNKPFNAGGAGLGTDGNFNDYVAPIETDWRNRRVAFGGAPLASGIHMVGFRNKNQFGNNIFVDNINVSLLFKRDIEVIAVNKPAAECSGSFTPNVTVRNNGVENVTAFSVSYRVDNGTVQTSNFTAQNIARNGTAIVNLTGAAGVTAGPHTITAFSSNPVTSSGTGDQFLPNDTLARSFTVLSSVSAPLVETFSSVVFPPAGWAVVNPNADLTWNRNAAGNNTTGSAFMNNYNYAGRGQIDLLYTPNIFYTGVDTVTLSFDISAVTKLYPGSQQLQLDTVEVLVTANCGTSFTSVYKKWGADLQTVGNPNDPQPFDFFPVGSSHWRTEKIDLTAFAPNGPLQVVFRNRNGFGNNVFIDNVNLNTRTLPASLKSDGLQLFPSPFQNSFQIWHLQTPAALRYANVYNSAGQMVWSKQFNADAPKIIDVDLSKNAAGVYIVHLGYTDANKNVQLRIVKTQ
jgi:hypothetical protein